MNVSRIGLLSFAVTTGVLYMIGHVWSIPSMMFRYDYQDGVNGFSVTCGSFLPVLIGVAVSFLMSVNKKKTGHT